jgi:hypothetical protein
MDSSRQREDPSWIPVAQRKPKPGRKPFSSATAEALKEVMSATEKIKVSRSLRNREDAQRSKKKQKELQLQRENAQLRKEGRKRLSFQLFFLLPYR